MGIWAGKGIQEKQWKDMKEWKNKGKKHGSSLIKFDG
jgi:hypothetical protein